MVPRSVRVPGAGGLQLHLLEWSREGVPLLLVHGFANDAHIWDDFAPVVAEHYRVLALDLRGHGDSDWHPQGAYDYDDHVADLEAVLDHLSIDRLVLVGHSLGGRVSMLFAGRHPGRMAGLVIVDSAPELDRRGLLRISLDTARNVDPSFASVAEYEAMLAHSYPAATPRALARMARHGLRQREDGRFVLKMDTRFRGAVAGRGESAPGAAELEAQQDRFRDAFRDAMWAALARVPCPTLVVRGAASDVLGPEVADRMADEVLAQGRLAVVARAGHSVMTDNPEGFEKAVAAFVLGES
jgi:pimeloyl-ACP methyl ester carboxylesterase